MVILAMLGLWPVAIGTASAQSGVPAVEGTLQFLGCEVGPDDLIIRARPVTTIEALPTEIGPGPINPHSINFNPTTRMLFARPTTTDTPGLFAFSFDGADPLSIYRVGVKLDGAAARRCPRFAWYSDRETLAVAGGEPLRIRGFALRSELQMFRPGRGGPQEAWVARDNIDFADPAAATKQFRWHTSLPGVTGGILQVSVAPFPKPRDTLRPFDPCATHSVIYSRSFQAAASGWTDVGSVDFHQILTDRFAESGLVDADTLASLQLGMPLYVRVVPMIAERMLCMPEDSGAPSEAVLSKVNVNLLGPHPPGPAITVDQMFYQPPVINPKHPKWGEPERCYRLIKAHPPVYDPTKYFGIPYQTLWDFYVAAKGLDGSVGQTFCVTKSSGDDGWFESLTSSVTSFVGEIVDGIGQLVDFAAKTWDDIKAKTVQAVADGLNTIHVVDCDELCQKGLRVALELAMASMGVPPSLPNFEQLQQQGLDYLAAEAAEATGVPEPIAQIIVNHAKEFVEEEASSMRRNYSVSGLPDWLAPDILLEPAVLTMKLWGTGEPLATKPLVIRNSDPIFAFANLVLPRRLPSPAEPSLAIPMVLQPNLEGLPEVPPGHSEYGKAVWFKDRWYETRFVNGCYELVLTALAPGDVISLFQAKFRADVLPVQGCVK